MDTQGRTSRSLHQAVGRRVKSKLGDDGKNFKCKKCGRLFKTSVGLSIHMRCHVEHHEKSHGISKPRQKIQTNNTPDVPDNYQPSGDPLKASSGVLHSHYLFSKDSEESCSIKTRHSKERQVCDICKKSFANLQVLRTHMRRHTGERPYFCTLCEKTFTQKNGLIVHMNTHANERFSCQKCGLVFTQLRSLKRHSKYHTGELQMKRIPCGQFKEFKVRVPKVLSDTGVQEYEHVFRCNFCRKDFKTGSQLKVHRRIHTNERPFECGVCQHRFKQKITLLDHEATHLPVKSFRCDQCGTFFKQQRTLRHHRKLRICEKKMKNKDDLIKKVEPLAKVSIEQGVECQEETHLSSSDSEPQVLIPCEQTMEQENYSTWNSVTELSKDQSIEIQGDSQLKYISDLDDKEGISKLVSCKSNLDHVACCTSAETSKIEPIPMFVCEYCGKVFKGKKNMVQHRKTHTDERPFVCGVCFKGFKVKATLVEHLETHTEGKPHACQSCGKHFKTQKCLQNHIGRNICTGVRPYACGICDKAFMYARYLEKHRCLGSIPKAFECGECGKKFSRNNLLTEHKRVHTGERPLECEDCGKKFAKRDLLRRHRLNHKDKQFECQECGKRFAQRNTLQAHMAVHSEDRKHVCDICNKAFKLASSLRNHRKAVHTTKSQAETKPSAYLCSLCGKVFRHLRWLLKHFCEASGVKRFQCSMCSKKFDKKQQLEVHSRTHTGIRPYKCPECGKSFTQTSSLKDHMVTHTGEKKHKCALCDSAFTRKNSLQRHKLIIHEGIEPFICNKCGLTFKYKKSFSAHVNMCEVVKVNDCTDTLHTEMVQDAVAEGAKAVHTCTPDLEKKVLDNILGNIERAMNGAGIEIRPDVQYQIIVGENANEVTVHVAGDTQ